MESLNALIKPLVGNWNALSCCKLSEWLNSGKIIESDLRRVLPSEMVDDFLSHPKAQRVGTGSNILSKRCQDELFTEVYFWGVRYSGKSTVIASILSAQPQSLEMLNTNSSEERARQQMEVFGQGESELVHFPLNDGDENNNTPNITRVNLRAKNGKGHRRYPLALIECSVSNNNIDIENTLYLNSQRDQIHILCWDPTLEHQDDQEDIFIKLLETLKQNQCFDRMVGIYLMVTKTDRFLVSDESRRSQIAQQIIVSDHPRLWAMVNNLSYIVGVYGARPVPFTIGGVFLQKLVRVNLQSARNLIKNQLLLKCQPVPTVIERVLSYGSLGLTILLVFAFCVGIGYSAWLSFSNVSTPPQSDVNTFDYQTYFLSLEKKQVKGHAFDDCYRPYLDLKKNLKTEKFVRERESNNRIFTQSLVCEQILYNDYAKALHNRNLKEFQLPDWTSYLYLQKRINEIISNKMLYQEVLSDLVQDTITINESIMARKIINGSKKCRDLHTVDSLKYSATQYKKVPIINDTVVFNGLNNVCYEAYNSYVGHIQKKVNKNIGNRTLCEAYRDTLKMLGKRSDVAPVIQNNISETLKEIESKYPPRRFFFW